MKKTLAQRDQDCIWHPFTQMKTAAAALPVLRAKGTKIWVEGKEEPYIDAVASWWMNLHGHSHPYIAEALYKQALELEHVIFANFTHEPAVRLGERLLQYLPAEQSRIFYSDNGSTSVEVALKMALQFYYNQGQGQKRRFIALEGAYHGDTFGAMAVGARSAFSAPFDSLLFEVDFIPCPLPGQEEESLQALKALLESKQNYAGFIFEPLVQGSGGMRMYQAAILDQLIAHCRQEGILCIADEVMTGFGRTGKFFATDALLNKPDIFCLSKGLTGGTMALGVTSCNEEIFKAFYADERLKAFFHGHSCTANPLACAVGLASLDLLESPERQADIIRIIEKHQDFGKKLQAQFASKIEHIRQQGVIFAFDCKVQEEEQGYFSSLRDRIWNFFIERHLILRPLGNTIYILPPYCISNEELQLVYQGIEDFLKQL